MERKRQIDFDELRNLCIETAKDFYAKNELMELVTLCYRTFSSCVTEKGHDSLAPFMVGVMMYRLGEAAATKRLEGGSK